MKSEPMINNKIIQLRTCYCYGNLVSYGNKKYLANEISIFYISQELKKNLFKSIEVRKNKMLQLYSTLALPILLYGK